METIERIKARRSIRRFTSQPVSHELIEKIVSAAAYAPSWKNTQTSRYIVVEDRALIQKIAQEGTLGYAGNQRIMEDCAALVVQGSVAKRSGYERDGSFSTAKGDKWEMFDAGIAAQTFMLAADELGIGSVVMGIFDDRFVHDLLELPEDQNVSSLIAIGYPDEEPDARPRKAAADLISYR